MNLSSVGQEVTPGALPAKPPLRLPTAFTGMAGRPAKNPRAEHRQAQRLRVEESVSLAQKYPNLKSLKGNLSFVEREGITKTAEIKYSANPEHAKSMLVFACPLAECYGGDFDLSAKLAQAIAKHQTKLAGDLHCVGIHKKASGEIVPCRSVLRFNLTLGYSKAG